MNYKGSDFSKRSVAHYIFPDISERSAVKKLYETIRDDPELSDKLNAIGYSHRKGSHFYTLREIEIIDDYLGVP